MPPKKGSFNDIISTAGTFPPESGRYHLYVGWFCPFAHRALIVRALKGLEPHIDISVVHWLKIEGRGGWKFSSEDGYIDKLYHSDRIGDIYEKASPGYEGVHSVPVLWDTKTNKIVNNESAELVRVLGRAFDSLPGVKKDVNLYPEALQSQIDEVCQWMQNDLNTGVYKAGFARDQAGYEQNVIPIFRALNRLESLIESSGGPYILGSQLTEVDVRAYTTIVRFDAVYVQHFKVNLGTIRHDYPLLNKWLKNLYWNHKEFFDTTVFKDIKLNYTKSHKDNNPLGITPVGPIPDVEPLVEVKKIGVELPEIKEGELIYGGRTTWDT